MRRALEAAAPLLGSWPLLDREALRNVMIQFGIDVKMDDPHVGASERVDRRVDELMEMARPMPTREQIEQRIRRIYIDGGAHITHAQEAAAEIATAVLALFNTTEGVTQ